MVILWHSQSSPLNHQRADQRHHRTFRRGSSRIRTICALSLTPSHLVHFGPPLTLPSYLLDHSDTPSPAQLQNKMVFQNSYDLGYLSHFFKTLSILALPWHSQLSHTLASCQETSTRHFLCNKRIFQKSHDFLLSLSHSFTILCIPKTSESSRIRTICCFLSFLHNSHRHSSTSDLTKDILDLSDEGLPEFVRLFAFSLSILYNLVHSKGKRVFPNSYDFLLSLIPSQPCPSGDKMVFQNSYDFCSLSLLHNLVHFGSPQTFPAIATPFLHNLVHQLQVLLWHS